MIDAKDLRIGNWVMDKIHGWFLQVDSITKGRISASANNCVSQNSCKNFLPIPLTPEILIDCEFEMPSQILTLNQHWFLCNNYDGFWIQIERQSEQEYICERFKIDCKYLHQLQNLYYSLTSTELIYKPK